ESTIKLFSKKEYRERDKATEVAIEGSNYTLEEKVIQGLGGAENIESVTNCATRLRVTVVDDALTVSDQEFQEEMEAMGVVRGSNSIQLIYGVRVQSITTRVKDLLGID